MQWLILIGDEQFDLHRIKAIDHNESIRTYEVDEITNRYYVDYGDDHIIYDYDEEVNEYEEEELEKIPFQVPHFVTMTYTSRYRLKKILQQDDFPRNVYVDNDFGLIVSLKEFIKLGMPLCKEDMIGLL